MAAAQHARPTYTNPQLGGPTAMSEPLLDRFFEVADEHVSLASHQVRIAQPCGYTYPDV